MQARHFLNGLLWSFIFICFLLYFFPLFICSFFLFSFFPAHHLTASTYCLQGGARLDQLDSRYKELRATPPRKLERSSFRSDAEMLVLARMQQDRQLQVEHEARAAWLEQDQHVKTLLKQQEQMKTAQAQR